MRPSKISATVRIGISRTAYFLDDRAALLGDLFRRESGIKKNVSNHVEPQFYVSAAHFCVVGRAVFRGVRVVHGTDTIHSSLIALALGRFWSL